ncbi:MAG: glycosyltransferase family 4 protein [Allopontixanthobacter sediminis]
MNAAYPLFNPGEGTPETDTDLRVCSVVTSLTTGGAENLVVNLGEKFAQAGIDHTVVALCDAETLGNAGETEAVMRERITGSGGRFRSLGLTRKRGWLSGARALSRCRQQLRPHIWHFHTARAVPMALAARLPEPAILTHHNSRLTFPPALFRLFDVAIAGYVAISPEIEAVYRKHARRPVHQIRNAAGGCFQARGARDGLRSPPRILAVGAVSSQKNYDLLIDTAVALRTKLPDERMPVFRIAGGGEGLEQLRARVAALELENWVHFLGERQDIKELMEQSDVLFNCSLYEGMAISMIEAMAMALPVVATPVPGNLTMVRHGVSGLLAASADGSSLANTLIEATENPHHYRTLSRGALMDSRQYSIDACARAHLELYRRVLRTSPGELGPSFGQHRAESGAPTISD